MSARTSSDTMSRRSIILCLIACASIPLLLVAAVLWLPIDTSEHENKLFQMQRTMDKARELYRDQDVEITFNDRSEAAQADPSQELVGTLELSVKYTDDGEIEVTNLTRNQSMRDIEPDARVYYDLRETRGYQLRVELTYEYFEPQHHETMRHYGLQHLSINGDSCEYQDAEGTWGISACAEMTQSPDSPRGRVLRSTLLRTIAVEELDDRLWPQSFSRMHIEDLQDTYS